jgi:hypothetical protein
VKRSAANLVIRHVGSYDVTVKPTVRNYSNASRVEFIPSVDPPVNSEDLIRQIVHKVLVWHMILGTDIFVFFLISPLADGVIGIRPMVFLELFRGSSSLQGSIVTISGLHRNECN